MEKIKGPPTCNFKSFLKPPVVFPSASSNIWREYPPVCGAAVPHPLLRSGRLSSSEHLRQQHRAWRTSPGLLRRRQHRPTCVTEVTGGVTKKKEHWALKTDHDQVLRKLIQIPQDWETAGDGATKEELRTLQEMVARLNVKKHFVTVDSDELQKRITEVAGTSWRGLGKKKRVD